MNYKIKYLSVAEQDIDEICDYLSQYYDNTFKSFLRKLKSSIGNLEFSPYLGTLYRDYRRLVVSDYLVFYRVDDNDMTTKICRVLHGSREFEDLL